MDHSWYCLCICTVFLIDRLQGYFDTIFSFRSFPLSNLISGVNLPLLLFAIRRQYLTVCGRCRILPCSINSIRMSHMMRPIFTFGSCGEGKANSKSLLPFSLNMLVRIRFSNVFVEMTMNLLIEFVFYWVVLISLSLRAYKWNSQTLKYAVFTQSGQFFCIDWSEVCDVADEIFVGGLSYAAFCILDPPRSVLYFSTCSISALKEPVLNKRPVEGSKHVVLFPLS